MRYLLQFVERDDYDRLWLVTDERIFDSFSEVNCAAHQINRCSYINDVTIVEIGEDEDDPAEFWGEECPECRGRGSHSADCLAVS